MRDLGQRREWCVDLENIALGLRAAHLLHEKQCQGKERVGTLMSSLWGPTRPRGVVYQNHIHIDVW